jgi:hypothetical protein
MSAGLQAFGEADLDWVRGADSIWSDPDTIIGGPNDATEDEIVADLLRQTGQGKRRPPGRVLVGQAGIGKTHLVGNLRRKIWAAGGWFVLLDVIGMREFWDSAALSFVTSLLQQMPDGRRQADAVILGVATRLRVGAQVDAWFRIGNGQAKAIVDLLVPGLARIDFMKAQQHQDVFRALVLLSSRDFATAGVAHAWLQGYDADEQRRKALGLARPPPAPIELVRGMSWLMSVAGPTLVAVDQVDGVINGGSVSLQTEDAAADRSFADLLSAGLLQLYDALTRSQTIVTCLLDSWRELERGLRSAIDRFQTPPTALVPMTETSVIGALIEARLAATYAAAGYRPPFPTWPFSAAAIESARGMAPRQILMACDLHRRRCLAAGAVALCDSFLTEGASAAPVQTPGSFDQAYRAAQDVAQLDGLLDETDDGAIGQVLRAAFQLYTKQIAPRDSVDVVSEGDPARHKPPLHGRLTFTFHDESDREDHTCFRAIEHAHAIAFSTRLRAAITASGIATGIPGRKLLIVRRGPVPAGAKTQQLHGAFLAAGGILINPTDADLRSFIALTRLREAAMADGTLPAFEAWLLEKKPLCDTDFFKTAGLCPPPDTAPRPVQSPVPAPAAPPTAPDNIPIGHRMAGGDPVELPTTLLPRHTAIIGGAGSGKTVLLRRIVEEAALAGIPAIVVDPNNDLSRLGDAWPERPSGFTDADERKAQRYRAMAEVVVWTPGVQAGNPLFLSVLPDFAALGDDPDERSQAVTMAAETLGPLAGAKTSLAKGVLSDALRRFAGKGGGTLQDMIALLNDLPEGVTDIGNAEKLAAKMADELKAAVATNPLLRAAGAVLDPRLLFFGRDPARTRVSVINLSGLPSADAREDFVNRLQMTLFGWIKKHPSPRGMLYVIDEAQSFIPSGAGAASKTSAVQLVAQARKYGLGMIVATQVPKGIDNKVVSNCTTQFLGKQNAPATIDAAKELIAAAGGRADDLGRLATGEFYFKTERSGKPFKLRTPICLSWHPPNPPTPEQVVARARQSAIEVATRPSCRD